MQGALSSQFLVYAAVFRLAIVGVGIACIVFGYRLLSKATGRKRGTEGSLAASVGAAHLTLQNLAPGTMFAAFGMIIVGVMLYQGMPELQDGTLVLRSDTAASQVHDLAALTERARKFAQAGQSNDAMDAYETALDQLATPTNSLALLYLQQKRSNEALALVKIAATLRPFRADILDTLADAYSQAGDRTSALQAAEKAAALDPQYSVRRDVLRQDK